MPDGVPGSRSPSPRPRARPPGRPGRGPWPGSACASRSWAPPRSSPGSCTAH